MKSKKNQYTLSIIGVIICLLLCAFNMIIDNCSNNKTCSNAITNNVKTVKSEYNTNYNNFHLIIIKVKDKDNVIRNHTALISDSDFKNLDKDHYSIILYNAEDITTDEIISYSEY